MFESCPKVNRMCAFCTKDTYNPMTKKYDGVEKLFCGVSTGFDTRVEGLEECWLKMTKSQRTTWAKKKNIEYQTRLQSGGFK